MESSSRMASISIMDLSLTNTNALSVGFDIRSYAPARAGADIILATSLID